MIRKINHENFWLSMGGGVTTFLEKGWREILIKNEILPDLDLCGLY